jgi:hypothetical protein
LLQLNKKHGDQHDRYGYTRNVCRKQGSQTEAIISTFSLGNRKSIAQRAVMGVRGIFSVPTTKNTLKLRRHENIEAATMNSQPAIPKEAFTRCFQDLQKRWQQCIDCGGDYFERERNH